MRKVYRFEDNKDYWDRRWTEAEQDLGSFTNFDIYPIKYAQMLMADPQTKTLEIGCGLGRVFKHYHHAGFDVCAIERSEVAVNTLLEEDSGLKVQVGDALAVPFEDEQFDNVMAFGVYHNLEEGMEQGLAEAARCLKPGGKFCITMRPDNIEMRLNERYWAWKQRARKGDQRHFHRLLVRKKEFMDLLDQHALKTNDVYYSKNVSILWRVPFLRQSQRGLSEGDRRAAGYRLNPVGRIVEGFLMAVFPAQVCNVMIFIGQKHLGGNISGN